MNLMRIFAALLLAGAVALGAIGAHKLGSDLDIYRREVFERAIFYHFIHGLGALIILNGGRAFCRFPGHAALLLLVGIVLFSGSLYLIAFTGEMGWRRLTPLGGTAFILGWCTYAIGAISVVRG